MADKRIALPPSTAGITRYFEEYKSKIEIKPAHVIAFSIAITLITILLHAFGQGLLK